MAADLSWTEIAALEQSEDYRERFKGEYYALRKRIHGLQRMLVKWNRGELDFDPSSSQATLEYQLRLMKQLKDVLEHRAQTEDIDL
jgi:hypothetical protein